MKAGEFIEALERFFLDIIGTVLPGLMMIVGFCYVTNSPPLEISKVLFSHSSEWEWAFLIAFSYILGHAITSLGYKMISKLENFCKADFVKKAFDDGLPFFGFVISEKDMIDKFSKTDPIYNAFVFELIKRTPNLTADAKSNTNARSWRNMALSIAPEQSQLIYRFMFIALLNLGVTTVCLCLLALWIVLLGLKAAGESVSVIDFNWGFILLAILPYFSLERFSSK